MKIPTSWLTFALTAIILTNKEYFETDASTWQVVVAAILIALLSIVVLVDTANTYNKEGKDD